ncbi:hypothetical protein ACTXGL_01335 [Psychrobacter sp. T6-6]|uniref:hypothetical protein n=1 Tax=Psychrobacter sp. T6-6 TaxID=3457452 RepID=UPI003FD2F5ED
MQLAQSYLQGQASPFDGVLEAYGQGQLLRQNKDLLQAKQAEQARKIAAQQALETIDWNDMSAVRRVVAQFPEYTKGAQDYYGQMEAKAQQGLLGTMSRGISALQSGSNQVAADLFKAQAEGYRNSGDEAAAKDADWLAEMSLTDPATAQRALMIQYAGLSDEKSGANLKAYGEALNPQRKEVDTGDQIQNYAIDPVTGEVSGAEWIADKAATPDNVLDNETLVGNNIRTNQANENNNIRTVTASENNNIRTNTVNEGNNIRNNDTSRYNTQVTAEMKKYGIDVNSADAQQKLQYERQQAAVKNKQGELKEAGGKYYFVNKSGEIYPAMGPDGKQLIATNKGKKPRTESQTKDYLFGSRMQEANNIVSKLERQGVDRGSILSRSGSLGETAANLLPSALGGNSPEQQQYIQAQRDFINAILRRESGAAIAESEFENARKQYFAQVGDSNAVKAQKKRNRELATAKLLESANGEQTPTVSGGRGNSSVDLSDLIK